jgi:hypothetical protein
MTSKYSGQEDKFTWFFGIVEDRKDPLKLGRVRVRAYNLHTDDKKLLPTDMLPWATPLQSVTSAGMAEIGQSPTGLMEGSVVWGFFADGEEAQVPMISGVLAGKPKVDDEETHDVAQRARGTDNLKNEYIEDVEPKMAYKGKYPYVKTFTSEANDGKGHLIEVDDTPSQERLLAWHTKGTYFEINQDGRLVVKAVDNSYFLTVKDSVIYVGGNCTVTVIGDAGIGVTGNASIEVVGSLSANIGGDMTVENVAGNTSIVTIGSTSIHSDGDINIESDSNINISADGNVKIKGSRIDLNE